MNIAPRIGAKFVQEVNAVCLAVEKMHPKAGSVVELGGQDAKIIVFKEDPETGRKKKIPSMNDKCAGGTGAVIDKINAKLRIPPEELCQQGYDGIKLHHVAGKCGVFAETDINGLQKQGIPTSELMASLFEAIIGQNLSVLTRGHTLRPEVILLGGPNTYIKGMREAWQHNIPITWREREVAIPDGVDPKSLIVVPQNAQYYAAIGAVEYGKDEDEGVGTYKGWADLEEYINERTQAVAREGERGLEQIVRRSDGVQGTLQAGTVRRGALCARRSGARIHRPGRRIDLDQGDSLEHGEGSARQVAISSPRATRSRTPSK